MRDFAFLDVVLEMLHLRGLTPADLLIRQRQLVADATPAPVAAPGLESIRESTQLEADITRVNQNQNQNHDLIDSEFGDNSNAVIHLDPEIVPTRWRRAIEEMQQRIARIAGVDPQYFWEDFRNCNVFKKRFKVSLGWMERFAQTWEDRRKLKSERRGHELSQRGATPARTAKAASAARSAPVASTMSPEEAEVRRALNAAPRTLLAGDEARAADRLGVDVWEAKWRAIAEQFAWSVEIAKRAAYGWAVQQGRV
jgi:hypothetical protein